MGRPLHRCLDCGHEWYPRGSNISRKCPSCDAQLRPELRRRGLKDIEDMIQRAGDAQVVVEFGAESRGSDGRHYEEDANGNIIVDDGRWRWPTFTGPTRRTCLGCLVFIAVILAAFVYMAAHL